MRALNAMMFAAVLLPASVQADDARPATRVPFDDCTPTHHLASFYRLADLPDTVQRDLAARMGGLADRGQPYQSTDALVLHGPPTRRFIRAAQSEHKLFVWYEQGGIAVRLHVLVYAINPAGGLSEKPAAPNFEADFVTFDACIATDAYLDGSRPHNGEL